MARPVTRLGGALLAILAAVPPAGASDYFHSCRTVGDQYEIEDGTLFAKGDERRTPIDYETVQETMLSEKRGYCVARGKRYQFEAKSYVLRVRFSDGGRPVELDALCELASDGLPAAYKCEREVVTRDFKVGSTKPPAGGSALTIWNHNGSLMRLEASGAGRRFVYEVPRRGMIEVGVKSGDVLFEGRREGPIYTGTAYIFTKACGRVGFPVAGKVSGGERRVVVEGQVPLHGPGCSVRAHRPDRLQFDLIER